MALTPKDIEDRFVKREHNYISILEEEIDKQLRDWFNPDERNHVTVKVSKYTWSFRSVATKVLRLYCDHWHINVQICASDVHLDFSAK